VSDRRPDYRPDIDGLRAIAVAVVVTFHAFPEWLPGGFVGVDIFFVISGFLISSLILSDLRHDRFSFKQFYARRIRRLFPALSLVLAAMLAVGWVTFFAEDFRLLGKHIAGGAGFVSNFLLWHESSYFDVSAERKPLLHLWSLAIEEQFYLVWPVLLFAASRWRRGPLWLTLTLGLASFVASIIIVRIDRTPAFYAPWYRFWEILAGAALACMLSDRVLGSRLRELTADARVVALSTGTGALMIVTGVALIDSTRVFPGLWVVLPVGGTMLVLASGTGASPIRSALSVAPLVWLGLISYPLYLWHWPLLAIVRMNAEGVPAASLRLLAVIGSVVLADLTFRFFERPVRFGAFRRAAAPVFAVVMIALAGVGVATYLENGFVERPVNRSDAAHFVAYYSGMKQRIASPFRAECDFMDWTTSETRATIDASCTQAGQTTYILWGDSYAQSLSLGIREQLPSGTVLAQVTTSACQVRLSGFDLSVLGRRCERANMFAIDSIRRLRPALVIVAQKAEHGHMDWARLGQAVLELGGSRVLVIGPFPRWRPSLPAIYADRFLTAPQPFVAAGLDRADWPIDRMLAERLEGQPNVTYLSLLERLCDASRGCLAQVPDQDPRELMTFDDGHLTPLGSSYVGRAILNAHLGSSR